MAHPRPFARATAPLSAASASIESGPALRRVLVATDFSTHADQAIARVAKLPLAYGARIELVHVVPDGDHASENVRRARSILDAEHERLVASLGPSIAPRTLANVVVGAAWTEIIRAARSHGSGLVVIGAHSKRRRSFALGSTAREVIRRGSSPVLVVRGAATRPYRRPLVAVDLSDVSRSVLEAALLVVEDVASLRLMHAYHVPFEGIVATSSSRSELAAFRRHYRDEARQRLSAFIDATASDGGRALGHEVSVRHGEPSGVIVQEIARRGSDLLVVGTHGRTGLSHLVFGSVAQSLLDHAPCDVLVLRPERYSLAEE
jgi:nucleotide-binding universal stress UspA family protein